MINLTCFQCLEGQMGSDGTFFVYGGKRLHPHYCDKCGYKEIYDETLLRQIAPPDQIIDIVDLLELSVRSNNALKALRVKTVLDLAMISERDLMGVKGCGKLSVEEIKGVRSEALKSAEWLSRVPPELIGPLTLGEA